MARRDSTPGGAGGALERVAAHVIDAAWQPTRQVRTIHDVNLERLRYVGWKVVCPICRGRYRSFAPDLWDGTRWHGELVRCPRCSSRPRHRWLWLYLHREPALLAGKAVLHVAPEAMIAPYIEATARDYVSTDVEPGRAAVQADLTALPFADAQFDTVVCSHVLEHVPDDHAALGEIQRVLRPGGVALIQTPVNYDQPATYEDRYEADEAERLRRFSQSDHVRVFGPDVRDRLASVGFDVAIEDAAELGADSVKKYGLQPNATSLRNDIYRCERRA